MTEKKNTRPSVAAPGQAVETGTPSKMASTSTNKFITFGGGGQRFRVADRDFGLEGQEKGKKYKRDE